jgi:hypothetical protein
MARKKRQTPAIELTELPAELPVSDDSPDNPEKADIGNTNTIRDRVRPMYDTQWDSLVSEMHDYTTTHRNLIEGSLSRSRERASKFVAYKKPVRGTAQTHSGIVLRDDLPAELPQAKAHVNLEVLYRNGRIKRKK